jgi:hypothetical protein
MHRVAMIYFIFCYKSPDSEMSIKWERNTTLGRFTKSNRTMLERGNIDSPTIDK